MNENDKKIQELEVQNEKFRLELENRDGQDIRNRKWHFWIARKTGGIFLGWRLRNSIRRLFSELKTGKVSSETLSDVSTHVLWRFTRIGLFAIFAALIPIAFLGVQTYILSKQNEKLDFQNKRIEQQTFLQEAERRSSLVFLFNNVLDKIDDELKVQNGETHILSDPLIGRIVSLSQALKPYRYLDGDEIIKRAISPERGQLLVSLIESNLDSTTYFKLNKKANFSYSELMGADLRRANLRGADLYGADLRGVDLYRADLRRASLIGADLIGADLRGADLYRADLLGTNLRLTDLRKADLRRTNLYETDLRKADLHGADLRNTDLREADLRNADLRGVDLRDADLHGADLREADLREADLRGADLHEADLHRARIDGLEWIANLGFPNTIGPSHIDSNYLVKSTSQGDKTSYYLRKK